MPDQDEKITVDAGGYRIGAVANLSGVPVATLRVWERRYGVVAPPKSQGGQRLYSRHDVLKLTLLKTLTQQGHAISSLAPQSLEQLQSMLNDHRLAHSHRAQLDAAPTVLKVAVVGYGLATRLESERFLRVMGTTTFQVIHVFADIEQALSADLSDVPDLILVQMASVQSSALAALNGLRQRVGKRRCVLIYHFATVTVLQLLHSSGVIARREPVSDQELSEMMQSVAYVDQSLVMPAQHSSQGVIPPRKYNDAVLQRMGQISTKVLCECPKHVADLLQMLNSFEMYSQDCLSNSSEDAKLHAYLTAVSGSARAMFEQALERIAAHENIDLKAPA